MVSKKASSLNILKGVNFDEPDKTLRTKADIIFLEILPEKDYIIIVIFKLASQESC